MVWLPLAILLSVCCVNAKNDGPKISSTTFKTPPTNLQFFEDSETALVQEKEAGILWRTDDAGETWAKPKDIEEGQVRQVWLHPHNHKVAYALSRGSTHWVSSDQGKSWNSFAVKGVEPSEVRSPLSFHAEALDKVVFNAQSCKGFACEELAYYTTDNFKKTELLRSDTRGCTFAHSTKFFKITEDDTKDNRILCVVKGNHSPWPKDHRLIFSDNYFEANDEEEPFLEENRTVQGILSMAMVKGFAVAAAKAEGTSELALYVSVDAKIWHRAVFPHEHKLEEDAYTILESTSYSLQVDVMSGKASSSMGVLFSSNSNGTYFSEMMEHTNRNFFGIVDFEKVQDIQGIILVNVVKNWKEVERDGKANRELQTQISFDDGRTFHSLKSGKENLHLHSVTAMENVGRVFSSAAPGLVMGVGSTGDYLKPYLECDTYVSDDAGVTWKLALESAHKYEFGDQGSVLLAVFDEGPTKEVRYSIDHGTEWLKAEIGNGDEIRARVLTTIPDSTSLKFVLTGTVGSSSKTKYIIYSIDFANLHERKCEKSDFKQWYARTDEHGDPTCLMGHKQFYERRKADADCFVDEEFKDPVIRSEICECTKEDFECDYNFMKSKDGKCEQVTPLPVPKGGCKTSEGTFEGSSGFRRIPGNTCRGGLTLDTPQERKCTDSKKKPVSGEISREITQFKGEYFLEHFYLQRGDTSQGEDETVVMRTNTREVYRSKDHGKVWEPILEKEDILGIVPNQYNSDVVYFLTGADKVHYSINRADTFDSFKTPYPPSLDRSVSIISFHPVHKDWLIWTGSRHCGAKERGDCHSVALRSEDRGAHWEVMLRYVKKCEFIKSDQHGEKDKLVYCEQFADEKPSGHLQLVSTYNWFADKETHFEDILAFATMSEFIIVANKDENHNLKVDASVDGKTFADAQFPSDFNVPVQNAYTVLDSSTHAVFLHVTVGSREGFEYGRLMKSNSNGTSYVLSIAGVNRNGDGYVDFEKMQGIEGVALVNVVANLEDEDKSSAKKLKTMITHNDGAQWAPLEAPKIDADGKGFECDVSTRDVCSLHLHGYTERTDPRDTYSSASAIGMMMGAGNVGAYLTRKPEADLFITRDAGVTWQAVKKGNYMWEYGDQGSIIVIVQENVATNIIFYSLDEGRNWEEYQFSDTKMIIADLTTLPSDNSKNFLLWGKDSDNSKEIATVNIDFSGLRDRTCKLDDDARDEQSSDYYLWSPQHPLQDTNCLFGHVAQYHRKKVDSKCWNDYKIHRLHGIEKNCTCTREDFEWWVPLSPSLQTIQTNKFAL